LCPSKASDQKSFKVLTCEILPIFVEMFISLGTLCVVKVDAKHISRKLKFKYNVDLKLVLNKLNLYE
jgi:hypothetical protein